MKTSLSMSNSLLLVLGLTLTNSLWGAERRVEDIAEIYRVAATLAASSDHQRLIQSVCPESPRVVEEPISLPAATRAPRRIPAIENWYREPARVFDELYFVGTNDHSSWAVVTDDGIMLLDTVYDYATGDAIVDGLIKLGFDPADIEFVFISHGHGDHHGGAKYLQDEFGAQVIMGAADWDLVSRDTRNPAPRRDIIATDGMTFNLGNTTITLYETPGHTEGTFSSVVTVHDDGIEHLAVSWGGTAIWPRTPTEQVKLYINSAVRMQNLVQNQGVDVLIANHLVFDHSREKLPLLQARQAGDPHPYVVGTDHVIRYLQVAENCARAEMAYR
ncbi:MAG TPA: MBL fold metallo-hydrolase [Gammaproteobacteria bacterium]|nr:MBL fold metallo-hydrolase [Gammaproteobacteria bacterium]